MKRLAVFLSAAAALCAVSALEFKPIADQPYQWGGKISRTLDERNFWGDTCYFAYVPERSARLRGVLIANANVIESSFCNDETIRETARRNDFAILYLMLYNRPQAPGTVLTERIQAVLEDLAEKSGYPELAGAPILFFGHSANSRLNETVQREMPERVLATVTVKGGIPFADHPETMSDEAAAIPFLFCNGEFEEVMPPGRVRDGWYAEAVKRVGKLRAVRPDAMLGGFLDRGHTHMDWCPDMAEFIALFIDKAIRLQLRGDGTIRRLDPASGVRLGMYGEEGGSDLWFFDRETAQAAQRIFARNRGKKEQILGFVQDGEFAPWWNGWALQELKFRPGEDGVTFSVNAEFYDKVPEPYADAGTPLGHGDPAGIRYFVSGWRGNTETLGGNRFRIAFNKEGFNGGTFHVVISAYHPGDDTYRDTISTARFGLQQNREGWEQIITFPPVGPIESPEKPVILSATSDSGLPVRYFVEYGPAVIRNGNELVFTPIPMRAKMPMEVKVTAYQWGRGGSDPVKTARNVSQIIRIDRKE